MGQLVQDGDNATLAECHGRLAAEDVTLGEGHRTCVFHRACVELRNIELVVLLERVFNAELLLEEVEALAGLLKHVVGLKILGHRMAAEHA